MSHPSSENLKRRGPNESTKNEPTDQQEADWGFESGEEGLGLEKKLGFALVLCLLAGFGFVFYQKYRILQRETVPTQAKSPDAGESDDLGANPTMNAEVVEPTHAGDSPFYETPTESEPDTTTDSSWVLVSEESTALPDAELASSPPADQPSSGTFDPFAAHRTDAPPNPPDDPMPPDVPAVTWEEGQFPSAPSPEELVPFEWDDPAHSHDPSDTGDATAANQGPSPFPPPAPTLADAPLQSGQPEPDEQRPTLENVTPDESESLTTDQPFPSFIDSPPAKPAPESAEPLPQIAASEEALPESSGDFDPFLANGPTTSETVPGPSPELPQFPAEDRAAAPAASEPNPVQTTEAPAWPFAETEDSTTQSADWASPPQQQEPDVFNDGRSLPSDPADATRSFNAAENQQQPPSQFPSTDPFGGNLTGTPIVPSIVSAQAVIGEREITVSHSDSFWSISEREYGTSRYYSALARYNRDRVAEPEKLQSGMTIRIPPPEVLEARFPELLPNRKQRPLTITPTSGSSVESPPQGLFYNESRQPCYRVGERDTLSTIAQQHLGRASRWTEIYELNRDQLGSPSTLKIGTVLKLPPATEGAIVWPEQDFSR